MQRIADAITFATLQDNTWAKEHSGAPLRQPAITKLSSVDEALGAPAGKLGSVQNFNRNVVGDRDVDDCVVCWYQPKIGMGKHFEERARISFGRVNDA